MLIHVTIGTVQNRLYTISISYHSFLQRSQRFTLMMLLLKLYTFRTKIMFIYMFCFF